MLYCDVCGGLRVYVCDPVKKQNSEQAGRCAGNVGVGCAGSEVGCDLTVQGAKAGWGLTVQRVKAGGGRPWLVLSLLADIGKTCGGRLGPALDSFVTTGGYRQDLWGPAAAGLS